MSASAMLHVFSIPICCGKIRILKQKWREYIYGNIGALKRKHSISSETVQQVQAPECVRMQVQKDKGGDHLSYLG